MANNQRRMLYSKIWTSQQVGTLSTKARLLYVGMITLADDDGRLVGSSPYLRGQVFPYDDISIEEITTLKSEIAATSLIECYKIGEFDYIQHPKWEEYQKIRPDMYKKSTLPSRNGTVTEPLQSRDENVLQVKLSKDKIIDTAEQSSAPIREVIAAFKEVNPAYEKWFANKTQREAVGELLVKHGRSKILLQISRLKKTNQVQYFPTITTPLQLFDKWAALEAAISKHSEGRAEPEKKYKPLPREDFGVLSPEKQKEFNEARRKIAEKMALKNITPNT